MTSPIISCASCLCVFRIRTATLQCSHKTFIRVQCRTLLLHSHERLAPKAALFSKQWKCISKRRANRSLRWRGAMRDIDSLTHVKIPTSFLTRLWCHQRAAKKITQHLVGPMVFIAVSDRSSLHGSFCEGDFFSAKCLCFKRSCPWWCAAIL